MTEFDHLDSIRSDSSFFAYRLPNEESIHTGIRLLPDDRTTGRGFFIHRYDPKDRGFCIRAACQFKISDLSAIVDKYLKHAKGLPDLQSTREADYRREVESTIARLDNYSMEKAIVWRKIAFCRKIDVSETFLNLCDSYPDAFIYCFSDSTGHVWLGATPELLLSAEDGRIESMALAGTRLVNSPGDWDVKNLEEQGIVSRYIISKFHEAGFEPEVSSTFSRPAGPVEHLCTVISAQTANLTDTELLDFAGQLSPTPAVRGLKMDDADLMAREYYSGFCGPLSVDGGVRLFVNLRVMKIAPNGFTLFSGGGITKKSNVDSEWEETERKASTLLDKVILEEAH